MTCWKSLAHTTKNRQLLLNIMTIKYGVTNGDTTMHKKTTLYNKKNNKKIIKRILTNFFFRILATCS